MTERFRSNGARAWLLRVLAAYVLVALLAVGLFAALVAGVAGPGRGPMDLIAGWSMLTVALNLVIVAAFVAGALLVFGWLVRAAREESSVNLFWRDNAATLEALKPHSLRGDAVREWSGDFP